MIKFFVFIFFCSFSIRSFSSLVREIAIAMVYLEEGELNGNPLSEITIYPLFKSTNGKWEVLDQKINWSFIWHHCYEGKVKKLASDNTSDSAVRKYAQKYIKQYSIVTSNEKCNDKNALTISQSQEKKRDFDFDGESEFLFLAPHFIDKSTTNVVLKNSKYLLKSPIHL